MNRPRLSLTSVEESKMKSGCPKEIKPQEYRVGLTPESVAELVANGHNVLVETNAGAGIGADDDAYRASGAGGQHVNKTDSAVRITHLPTNTVVQCQNDRSQHKNRDSAFKQLKAKLYELEMHKQNADKQAAEDAKSDIGWGSQIRSYVLDDARIKDLRTGVENRNTQSVLDGDLDQFIQVSLKQGV